MRRVGARSGGYQRRELRSLSKRPRWPGSRRICDAVRDGIATAPQIDAATELAHAIVCASCSHPVTKEAARVARAGSHIHTRLNPGGWVWEFGCFGEASVT